MGVYIKGMEMPTNCFLCPLSVLNGERLFCVVTKDEVIRAKRSSCCPLCLVPPHGRLIDADKIRYHSGTWEKGYDWVMQSEIALMPTVIPAEEEGET